MLKVIETFSGVGSQAKALKNIGVAYEIAATVEWDITAIYAYDIIHNGPQIKNKYEELSKKDLIELLRKHTISGNGKIPAELNTLKVMSKESLSKILYAIDRNNNLVSITDVKATDFPQNIDLLTYSFPCQDLSICGSWHGNMSGIDRGANNRSGMLWEVERILKEYVEEDLQLPQFLLMENVSNILSETHRHNFEEWKNYLQSIGYYNKVYTLNALDFGIPQRRVRTYMVSIHCETSDMSNVLEQYFFNNNLENISKPLPPLKNYLRLDYTNTEYLDEANISNPNFTESRKKIFEGNTIVWDYHRTEPFVKTITTKQDRNPNSGLLLYKSSDPQKAPYRNLTPRECFLLMGFEECDFQSLMDNNFFIKSNSLFFTREKLIKLAGNSIAVPVLEEIFKQINEIKDIIAQNDR